ncbi:uncharacterized protein EV420DRAFT_1149802 [Desarmillaria tabescens]|uniref:DUF6534 domain-containing protein n=1 Tax=Armillaria tabescens TaxID=1929756 RepID=A0AA39NCC6_ARMTA|nr:uncharacterized protein EV420DRAFT_1149802 [Desarmillaria tabescens]KAK0463010.1 hypothetical protein EV420DRAFT_1149802 [Desarmillaria tabescens]
MCIDLFLQGILTSQFFNYYSWYGRTDGPVFTIPVGILSIMTTLKSIQAFAIVWVQQIQYFNDVTSALQMRFVVWYQIGNPLMVALIAFYVQCYFCYRLWAVSKTWYVAAPIGLLYILSVSSVCVATYYIVHSDPLLAHWLSVHYATVSIGDLLLAVSTAFFLLRTKNSVLPQTVGLINSLVRLTFQTAAPPAICVLLNLIFIYLPNPNVKGVSSTFEQILPKLYGVSMMWTLNSRRNIRPTQITYSYDTSSRDAPWTGCSRSRRRHDDIAMGGILKFSNISGIQVVSHMEACFYSGFVQTAEC